MGAWCLSGKDEKKLKCVEHAQIDMQTFLFSCIQLEI